MESLQQLLSDHDVVGTAGRRHSWPQLHKFLTSSDLKDYAQSINVSSSTIVTITLQVIERSHQKKWTGAQSVSSATDIDINDAQAEILQYIAGAILHKLRIRYKSQKKFGLLDELEGLVEQENEPKYRLIDVKTKTLYEQCVHTK